MEISRNTSQALHTVLGVSGFFGARMFLLNEITARKKGQGNLHFPVYKAIIESFFGESRHFWGWSYVSTLRPDSSQEAKEL